MSKTPARKSFLFDLFVTAIESGPYGWQQWARVCDYNHESADNFGCILIDDDHWLDACREAKANVPADRASGLPKRNEVHAILKAKGQLHIVNADTMAKGLGVLKASVGTDSPMLAERIMKPLLKASSTNGDGGDYDVIGADAVLQAAVLGSVVYG